MCRNFPHMQQSTPLNCVFFILITLFILVLTFCTLFGLGKVVTGLHLSVYKSFISFSIRLVGYRSACTKKRNLRIDYVEKTLMLVCHCQVEYDPKLISYERLLNVFWANHDPTQIFGQGPDVGPQYR